MQAFQAQTTEDFLRSVGSLLTEAVVEEQRPWQQRAVQELGAYVQAARTFHQLSLETFAAQLDLSATDLTALEHGLFPYARLTAPFIETLAAACREETAVLIALLHAAQNQAAKQQRTQATTLQLHDWEFHNPSQRPLLQAGAVCGARLGGTSCTQADQRQIAPQFGLLRRVALRLRTYWHPPKFNFAHSTFGVVSVAALCCLVLFHVGFFLRSPLVPSVGTNESILAVDRASSDTGDSQAMPAVAEVAQKATATQVSREAAAAHVPTADPYQIIYTTDVLSDHRLATSPLIPVSGHQLALIQLHEAIPKIFYLCRAIGQMESCPM
ncbi:MAG: hypothetical protein KDE47_18000 [Caldilineaceae bacterium]|nr:hypothetical protein [Caldilineaceae bacterium]